MKYDFQISGETFGGSRDDPVSGKSFIDSCALGFSWRPGEAPESGLVSDCSIDGSSFSEGIRLSFVYDMVFRDCKIFGGREACLVIIRGGRIIFDRCEFISRGKTKSHVSIKGGAKDICFRDCLFVGNYKSLLSGSCIDLGGWSPHDLAPRPFVRRVKIFGCKVSGVTKRVFCRIMYSESPLSDSLPGKILGIPRFLVNIFWFLKRKGITERKKALSAQALNVYEVEL